MKWWRWFVAGLLIGIGISIAKNIGDSWGTSIWASLGVFVVSAIPIWSGAGLDAYDSYQEGLYMRAEGAYKYAKHLRRK